MATVRLQKFAPMDREYPIFEVIDEANNVLLDISRRDSGEYELTLHGSASGKALPLLEVLELILKAKEFLDHEPSASSDADP